MRAQGAAPRGGTRGHGYIDGRATIIPFRRRARSRVGLCGLRLALVIPAHHTWCRICYAWCRSYVGLRAMSDALRELRR